MPVGSDGNRQLNGKDVNLSLCTTAGNPTRLTELQKVQGYLQAIHIKSHSTTVCTADLFKDWTSSTPDHELQHLSGHLRHRRLRLPADGQPVQRLLLRRTTPASGPELAITRARTRTNFSDPAMDAALAKLKTDVDLQPSRRTPALSRTPMSVDTPRSRCTTGRRRPVSVPTSVVGRCTTRAPPVPLWNVEDWFSKSGSSNLTAAFLAHLSSSIPERTAGPAVGPAVPTYVPIEADSDDAHAAGRLGPARSAPG